MFINVSLIFYVNTWTPDVIVADELSVGMVCLPYYHNTHKHTNTPQDIRLESTQNNIACSAMHLKRMITDTTYYRSGYVAANQNIQIRPVHTYSAKIGTCIVNTKTWVVGEEKVEHASPKTCCKPCVRVMLL